MIGVCGAGSWGTALAAALARNTTHKVLLWGREQDVLQEISGSHCNSKYLPGIKLPSNIVSCTDLGLMLRTVQDLLIAVPSHAFHEILLAIKPYITEKHRIIWATKGLETKQGRFLHELVIEEFGLKQIFAILSGPSFAKEVARQLPTAVTIATNNPGFDADLLSYFHSDNFRVYLSTDIIGLQVGGVIKNILAVAAGISDGLGFGANARAALITRGFAEMIRFGLALGAKMHTMHGLAGIGDIILTCTDDQSRNRRFGLALAKGKNLDQAQAEIGQVVEAIYNAAEVCRIAAKHKVEMPIATEIYKIFNQELSPQQAVANLMSRKPSYEWTE